MARRRGPAGTDPLADLAKKVEILEQELAVQRAALDRLKEMAAPAARPQSFDRPVTRTA